MKHKRKNSNIEILRLIAVVFITFNHIATLGVANLATDGYSKMSQILLLFFMQGGKFGSNIFMIISIWYLCNPRGIKSKILKIWEQTFFYSISLALIDLIIFRVSFSSSEVLKTIFPVLTGTYWYSTAYIFMLLCIPFLRLLVNNLRHIKLFLIAGGCFLSIFPVLTLRGTFVSSHALFLCIKILTYPPVWFCYIYALFYYMRKNHLFRGFRRVSPRTFLQISAGSYIIMFLLTVLLFLKGNTGYSAVRDIYSPFCIISAFFLFVFFKTKKAAYYPRVNLLSKHAFGIYLLQCHLMTIPILWKQIFQFQTAASHGTAYLLLYSLFAGIVIIVIGLAYDLLYGEFECFFPVFSGRLISLVSGRKQRRGHR